MQNNPLPDDEQEIDDILLPTDPVEAAQAAGLYYVMEGEPGFTRRVQDGAFVYLDWNDRPVTNARQLTRIRSLVIPPAWSEVWICRRPNGHIQATGRDKKGRKQYRYHAEWSAIRSLTKFDRILAFAEALPAIRARVNADLRRQKLSHEKVVALVVRLLDRTLLRVGNLEYARQNNSYGLTTLLDDHISVNGARLSMAFVGKRGKPFEVDLNDRRLSSLVKRCQDLPGQRLFQYLDENGQCCQSVTSGDVNAYLRMASSPVAAGSLEEAGEALPGGYEFSAKDFRTWGGTTLAALDLYQLGPHQDEKQAEKHIVQVVKQTAASLGNTPAICRSYYIHPAILQAYRDGSLFEVISSALQSAREPGEAGLTVDEQAVLVLLKQHS